MLFTRHSIVARPVCLLFTQFKAATNNPPHALTKGVILLLFIALAAFAAFGVAKQGWFVTKARSGGTQESAAGGALAPSRVTVSLITLRPSGFWPSRLSRPKGPFILAIENRTGLQQIAWRLSRERGDKLKELPMPRAKKAHKELIDLPPGTYVLTEANHPDWVCHITIDNK